MIKGRAWPSPEIEHQERGKVVGSVLLSAEYWQPEDVKHGMTHLVGKNIEELTEHRVRRGQALHRGLFRHGLLNFAQVLVAYAYGRFLIPSV